MNLFKTRGIGFKIASGYSILLFVVALMGVIGYFTLRSINQNVETIAHRYLPAIDRLVQADRDFNQLLVAERSMIFADVKSDEFKKLVSDYEENLAQAKERFGFYKTLASSDDERSIITIFEGKLDAWQEISRKIVNGRKEDSREGRRLAIELSLNEAQTAFEEMRDQLDKLEEITITMSNNESTKSKETYSQISLLWTVLVVFSFIVGIALAYFIGRSITVPINNVTSELNSGAQQISSAANQLSSSGQQLSDGASEQASSLEEISSSLEEMASMTKQNAENTNQCKLMSVEASSSAQQGADAIGRMNTTINKIKTSADETAKIVKTIDEIAMQTNLLALNAAVEAARAGEAGKGFAVVAEEVRNLAQRAADAAKETAAKIEESQKNAESGVNVAQEVNNSLGDIVDKVSKVGQLIAEVSAASGEQAQGIDQVNIAVSQMDKITQQNAANAEESAAASEELDGQAQGLNAIVVQLVSIVEGTFANRANNFVDSMSIPVNYRLKGNSIGLRDDSTSGKNLKSTVTMEHPSIKDNSINYYKIPNKKMEVAPEQVIPFDDDTELKKF